VAAELYPPRIFLCFLPRLLDPPDDGDDGIADLGGDDKDVLTIYIMREEKIK
jgi:hypothetical protein